MKIIAHWTNYRKIGLILILISLSAYLFVADETRHIGELIGVTDILISGLLFLLTDSFNLAFRPLAFQWIPIMLLLSIPIGGILLDNMVLSSIIGAFIGIAFVWILRKK